MKSVKELLTNTWVLFAIIICFAAIFRISFMQYVEFKGDEALNLLLASRFLFHHPFSPASLTSSAGILNFPLINFLLAPIVIFTLYPPTISLIIAIANTLTVGGYFLLFSKYHGKVPAFLTSCIIAFSPWAILYSRKIWEQDFLLLLALPFFLSIYKIFDKKTNYWFLFGISSMLLLQIHQLAILVVLIVFVGLLIEKHKPQWKLLLAGILIGLVPTIPYFFYIVSNHFTDLSPTSSLATRFSFHELTTFLRPLQIISIGNFHTELGSDFAVFAAKTHLLYLLSKSAYISYLILPLGLLFVWIKKQRYRLFVGAIITLPLVYFALGIEPLMHYFILLIPLLALCSGEFLAFFMMKRNYLVCTIAIIVTAGYIAGLIAMNSGFFILLTQKGGLAGDYGGGYASSEKGILQIMQKFRKDPNYKELLLFYFSPISYFHGYMPLGRLLFPYSQLAPNEQQREKQFTATPTNPLLRDEIFAYYTQSKLPTWRFVLSVREKAKKHSSLMFVYQEILQEYLSAHYKKLYEAPDFLLLYPQHWSSRQDNNTAIFSDGQILIRVEQEEQMNQTSTPTEEINQTAFPGQHIQKATCIQKDIWCGTTITSLFLRAHFYSIEVTPVGDPSKSLQTYAENTLHDIMNSITVLP